MNITKHDATDERRVLTSMIVDSAVLGRIASIYRPDLFKSKYANLVAGWCMTYYEAYGKAPMQHIETKYERWATKTHDESSVELVGSLLQHLSDRYVTLKEQSNSDYMIDLAGQYFNQVRLERLVDDMQLDIDANAYDDAQGKLTEHKRVEMGTGEGVNVLQDIDAMKQAFDFRTESMVKYPGDLEKFFGSSLSRDSFVAFMGPEKRGKCIHGNSLVLLEDGRLVPIHSFETEKEFPKVICWDEVREEFTTSNVTKFHKNGRKVCYRLETKTGRVIEATANHQFITPAGWIPLSNLKVGDFLAVPKRMDVWTDIPIQEEAVRFLAYMIADGCCVKTFYKNDEGDRVLRGTSCTFTKTDPVLREDFKSCCRALGFGYKSRGLAFSVSKARPFLKRYGVDGHSAKTKRIPQEVFTTSKQLTASFLRTLFTCDGWISETRTGRQIGISLSNKPLVHQISQLLTKFGIVAALSKKRTRLNGKKFISWCLSIRASEHIELFLREINFASHKYTKPANDPKMGKSFLDKFPPEIARAFYEDLKKEYQEKGLSLYKELGRRNCHSIRYQLNKNAPIMRCSFKNAKGTTAYARHMNSDLLWDSIVEIENIGSAETYDITVNKHHNFIANNIVVHNSFWLLDIAWRSMEQRNRVAYFEAGDHSQNQVLLRFYKRACRRCIKPDTVSVPKSLSVTRNGEEVVYHTKLDHRTFTNTLTPKQVARCCEKIMRRKVRSSDSYFKLSCHPNSTLSIEMIESILKEWERREEWVPDVIVIDYADILNMEYRGLEGRDRINETWKRMRSLSQKLHCLVVTATQADARSYSAETVDMSHFSEDKRKVAHVTGMIGLNQNDDEKEKDIMRLNWIAGRDFGYSSNRCIFVAGCRAIANIAMKSCYL